ncbi:MAG: RibD family protein [Cyanobacteria bacterium P01_A01_bin.105]
MSRPHVTVILAMSADGKITDAARSPARFPSQQDQQHLQTRVAEADATLFGAGTLRAYGTTLSVRETGLLAQRQRQGRPPQPIQIVCSASGQLDPTWRFFSQPIPRWLLTTALGGASWQSAKSVKQSQQQPFARILTDLDPPLDWQKILTDLYQLGIHRLLVMGGGQLVAAIAAIDAIDDLWLTVCPLLIGGQAAPTPMDGPGLRLANALKLKLLTADVVKDEIFLHYQRHRLP